MEEEQVYTIPLREVKEAKRKKRCQKAMKVIKNFLKKHENVSNVSISNELNEEIWEKGAEKPPSKVRVRIEKSEEDMVEAFPLD